MATTQEIVDAAKALAEASAAHEAAAKEVVSATKRAAKKKLELDGAQAAMDKITNPTNAGAKK